MEKFKTDSSEYEGGIIRGISSHSVVILQSSSLTSVSLKDLPPELQERFGYDPAKDVSPTAANGKPVIPAAHPSLSVRAESPIDTLFQNLGPAPAFQSTIDLRPQFTSLELGIKNQGRRPSCSIFAMVSALEYQNALVNGAPEKLSEEYLIWATRHLFPRAPVQVDAEDEHDDGFSLEEVATALRTYGIPLQAKMPNILGGKIEKISEPPTEVIEEAKNRRRISVRLMPGRDHPTQIKNFVHALNAGVPVTIAVRWPHYRTIRTGYLSEQKPILDYSHAVTLVGYKNEGGRIEDSVFIFKNSYGVDWGMGGHGEVTFGYLNANLLDAVVLEVQRGTE